MRNSKETVQWAVGVTSVLNTLPAAEEPTFDLMVRSERLAAAAAILRMSGLLLDFMISRKKYTDFKQMHEERGN